MYAFICTICSCYGQIVCGAERAWAVHGAGSIITGIVSDMSFRILVPLELVEGYVGKG